MSDVSFKSFVLDQLSAVPRVTARAMFGGYGLYQGRVFFGIIFKGRLYFKTNEASAATYRARGMKPFRPSAAQTLKTYYEVPVEILEDAESAAEWATTAIASQHSSSAPRRIARR